MVAQDCGIFPKADFGARPLRGSINIWAPYFYLPRIFVQSTILFLKKWMQTEKFFSACEFLIKLYIAHGYYLPRGR
jgi:hypothetical protein